MAALAVGRGGDQLPGRALAHGQLRAAEPERAGRVALERAHVEVLELPPALDDPRAVLAGQEAAAADEQGGQRRAPGPGPVPLGDRRLGPVGRLVGDLEVDPGVGREPQPHRGAAGERLLPERSPQAREQRAQRRAGAARRRLAPQRVDQHLPRRRPAPVRDEVGEEQPPLAPGQLRGHVAARDLHVQEAAELDSRGGAGGQRFPKVPSRWRQDRRSRLPPHDTRSHCRRAVAQEEEP